MRSPSALGDPITRTSIAALAATAGLGGGIGWWQHGDGGYGWVGPLFWPFAYYDIYDYAMWGYDPAFWDYGYADIYAGLFAPYGYDDLIGYVPRYGLARYAGRYWGHRGRRSTSRLAQMCGDDRSSIVDLPIDQIERAVQLNDPQRAALDDLANALMTAAQSIKAACPTDISLTAPGRLAVMQLRVEAMIAAVGTVQPPLQKFYDLLDDEQKARFTALGEESRKNSSGARGSDSLSEPCGAPQPGVTEWPITEIEQRVHPTDAQRMSLAALQEASAKAADMLKASCQPDTALTPPARLALAGQRLETMLEAIKTVRAALNEFYGTLSDEQKAQFEAIGRERVGRRVELFDRPMRSQAADRAPRGEQHQTATSPPRPAYGMVGQKVVGEVGLEPTKA